MSGSTDNINLIWAAAGGAAAEALSAGMYLDYIIYDVETIMNIYNSMYKSDQSENQITNDIMRQNIGILATEANEALNYTKMCVKGADAEAECVQKIASSITLKDTRQNISSKLALAIASIRRAENFTNLAERHYMKIAIIRKEIEILYASIFASNKC